MRTKPVFELVKGIVDLVATKLYEAARLRIDKPQEMFTPFAQDRFDTEHAWSLL